MGGAQKFSENKEGQKKKERLLQKKKNKGSKFIFLRGKLFQFFPKPPLPKKKGKFKKIFQPRGRAILFHVRTIFKKNAISSLLDWGPDIGGPGETPHQGQKKKTPPILAFSFPPQTECCLRF